MACFPTSSAFPDILTLSASVNSFTPSTSPVARFLQPIVEPLQTFSHSFVLPADASSSAVFRGLSRETILEECNCAFAHLILNLI